MLLPGVCSSGSLPGAIEWSTRGEGEVARDDRNHLRTACPDGSLIPSEQLTTDLLYESYPHHRTSCSACDEASSGRDRPPAKNDPDREQWRSAREVQTEMQNVFPVKAVPLEKVPEMEKDLRGR